ncbi:MAG: DNA polymerase-3 subunit delta' [Verrucomicrobiales bacterium]|jgi:DNA polymerase-3 subunit delta'
MIPVWESIKASIDADRLAHAYIVEGPPYGTGRAFADQMVRYLFCPKKSEEACDCSTCIRITHGAHPDVFVEQPRSLSRQILKDQVKELNRRINQSAFEGGWKVCMIADAHRMNTDAANKFLKTLEEPPERTLILLLTDEPTAMLATIISRCQRIILPEGLGDAEEADWHAMMLDILRIGPPRDTLMLLTQAGAYEELFSGVAKEVEASMKAELKGDETLDDDTIKALVRSEARRIWHDMFLFIERWYRDLFVLKSGAGEEHLNFKQEVDVLKKIAQDMSYDQARRKLDQVPRMARRISRNLPIQEVFEAGLAG